METRTKIETRIAFAEERFILPLLYPEKHPLEISMWEAPGEPVTYAEAMQGEFTPVKEGAQWGPEWGTAWFHFTGTVPAEWSGKTVVALVDLSFEDEEGFGREGQVWKDGKPVIAVSRYRSAIPVEGTAVDFHVEAAANPLVTWHWAPESRPAPDERLYRLKKACLAVADPEVFALLMDFRVCKEAMLELPLESTRRARLTRGLDLACRKMEVGTSAWVAEARAILAPLLAAKNGSTMHRITATGHAHIDTAWCWPLRETIRKCARTFSTALAYMERYPDYHFSCSQPVQYLWMRELYPHIYEGIKAAVKRGQWEPIGSMWVEPDCNVPSGEALVRQLVHGKAFFEEEFGVTTRDLWLPDVFGYSAALPQILRKAGVDRFLTQKISWNDTNKFPHHTFLWEGIDGTRIFSHFPPVDTYNARVNAGELGRAERQFAQKDVASRSLMPFGYGDGGGGPSIEMIERIRRFNNFEGLAGVEMGTVSGFFEEAEKEIAEPPVWVGELYLELHRGTYTSQAHNKLMNRRCELLLRDAEFLDAICSQVAPGELLSADPAPERVIWDVDGHIAAKDGSITAKALDRAWKLLLLNQFHDILPGSSIGRVYVESRRDYEVIEKIALAVRDAAVKRLAGQAEGHVAFNTLAQFRDEIVELPDGTPAHVTVPACGYANVSAEVPHYVTPVRVDGGQDGMTISNGLISAMIHWNGTVQSLVDLKTGREMLDGPANELHLLRDYPNRWNAWDIEGSAMDDYEVVGADVTGKVLEDGPLRVVVQFERKFGKSTVLQKVILRSGSARLDFDTTVDWQERNRVLKVSFPLAIRTEHAVFEIQSGHVRRPVHRNTSWDAARFEVPMQRWVDLSESDAGIALLNNGSFGCDVLGGRIRLTLLKSASAPDPTADIGVHHRVFSLFPHSGGTTKGEVIEEALALNTPLIVAPGAMAESTGSWLNIGTPGVTLEALKRSEDGKGVVARVLEAYGRQTKATVTASFFSGEMVETDLLEKPLPETAPAKDSELALRPFDLRTLRSV